MPPHIRRCLHFSFPLLVSRADSLESREFDPDGTRVQGGFLRQNSLREWDIPFQELDIGTKIGKRDRKMYIWIRAVQTGWLGR